MDHDVMQQNNKSLLTNSNTLLESGVSGGGWLVEHHRTSVLVGLTIKRFEAIHLVMYFIVLLFRHD